MIRVKFRMHPKVLYCSLRQRCEFIIIGIIGDVLLCCGYVCMTSSTEEPGTSKSTTEMRILRIQNFTNEYFLLKGTTISQRIIDSRAWAGKEHGSGKYLLHKKQGNIQRIEKTYYKNTEASLKRLALSLAELNKLSSKHNSIYVYHIE